jgi:hypothetical protein
MSAAVQLLADLMETFARGGDRSMALVDRIEGLLIQRFQDGELYEELSPAVASYRSGGGDHLFDEEALAAEFRYALQRLHEEGELGPDLT